MRLLQFLGFERKSETQTISADQIRALLAADASYAGETVNTKTALQSSAVLACARVIAEGLAQVPLKLYREDSKGSPVEAREHPLFQLLHRRPNDWQTSFELREQIGLPLVLTNNAYVYVNRVGRRIVELYAFDPNTVTVEQRDDLTLTYRIRTAGKALDIPAGNMWHLRGPSWNGFCGMNAVALAQRAIGLSQATERFGSKFFENSGRPGGILTARQSQGVAPLTKEQREQIAATWKAQNTGADNAHRTVLLPFDLDFKAITSTANEAQWIETRQMLVREICRFFRVLPIMVMESDNSTSYASVEQLFQAHLTHTLMPWFQRFEQSAEASLLSSDELNAGYHIRLSANALLRGSTQERAAYYQTMKTIGAMTANEIRAKEDMPRSDDPEADKLTGAANIFGGANKAPNTTSQNDNNNEVTK